MPAEALSTAAHNGQYSDDPLEDLDCRIAALRDRAAPVTRDLDAVLRKPITTLGELGGAKGYMAQVDELTAELAGLSKEEGRLLAERAAILKRRQQPQAFITLHEDDRETLMEANPAADQHRAQWAADMFKAARPSSTLHQMMPKPAPLTRTQRLRQSTRRKIEAARLRVGSWIAGVDLGGR